MKYNEYIIKKFNQKQYSDIYSNKEWFIMGTESSLDYIQKQIQEIIDHNDEILEEDDTNINADIENKCLDNLLWLIKNGDIGIAK